MCYMKYNLFSLKTLIIACFLFLASCVKENIDPVTGKKSEPWEPNSDARARKYADENPIFIKQCSAFCCNLNLIFRRN